jgi:kynureninase
MEVDNMTVASQVKQTIASLKGARGTLNIYTVQTSDDEIQSVYTKSLEITDNIISDLEERLKVLEFEEPQYKGN